MSNTKTSVKKSTKPKLTPAQLKNAKNKVIIVNKKKKAIYMSLLVFGVPLLLLAGLLINYLVYFPLTHDHATYKVEGQEHIAAFVITMVLSVAVIGFVIYLYFRLRDKLAFDKQKKINILSAIGTASGFLDAIGVGSYSVALGLMKATKTAKDDRKIPGTMTIGFAAPQMMESAVFVSAIQVEWETLLILTACAIVGGILGSLIANKINSQVFRFVVGIIMAITGIIMILVQPAVSAKTGILQVITGDGEGYYGFLIGKDYCWWRLVVSSFAFVILGGLAALGLGMFAPSLAVLTLLGMNTSAIFPIMSLAASAMMPPTAIKFFKDKNYLKLHAVIFSFFSAFGILASFCVFFVGVQAGAGVDKNTFNDILRWIATGVVFYCATILIIDFVRDYRKTGWAQPTYDPDVL